LRLKSTNQLWNKAELMSINTAFYQIAENVAAYELANIIGAKITGIETMATKMAVIKDIVSFHSASASTLIYQTDPKLLDDLKTEETIIITNEDGAAAAGPKNICLVVPSPRVGFARAVDYLISEPDFGPSVSGVSPNATIAQDTVIHPSATIMARASIGSGTVVEAGAIVHPAVKVGKNCLIGANAVLSYSVIGNHVNIGAGSIIGAAGFGFEMTDDGAVKIPHIGLVSIANSVSIGSSCTIDRGSLDNTIIGEHVMIDNLCHIAHNVKIGPRSIISGQCGISGSATVGMGVVMGGQVGIAPHVFIGDGAVLTARSGVTKDVHAGEQVAGFPATSSRQFWRDQAAIRRLSKSK
jgi:UDP-3-O-[3-hydroxymyristoyl] glucosamine N-acyltransferase